MKLFGKLIGLSLASVFAISTAMAAEKQIVCQNDAGFTVTVDYDYEDGLGSLSYGMADDMVTVNDADLALNNGFGAVIAGADALLVITPAPQGPLGEFVAEGKTTILSCK